MKFIYLSKLAEEYVYYNPEIRKKLMLRAGELPHLTNFSQAIFNLNTQHLLMLTKICGRRLLVF
ncbi:MAG: hypothetical protein QNJ49_16095 [Mastigocoleus sp. MO_167.B18]|nr:hypothetical protein [Mastigocoleus sp. MO_167.B18]